LGGHLFKYVLGISLDGQLNPIPIYPEENPYSNSLYLNSGGIFV